MDKAKARDRMEAGDCVLCGAEGNESLAYGSTEIDSDQVFQKVSCMACNETYYEVYNFVGVLAGNEEIFGR